ncbi:Hsp20/alpha crystallin family protein [Methylogaea oryzae]|uniref:Heat-shock protein Hsp20 n=1 Tax=Methylogaea oryzae TaxID=1295382 RepID=A0A8D4VPH7_9GAMM|nr:Hsp20/alpha crystallin family protein [Methylogaea oryzae]BBL70105.1 heat-shock protein Hsp20 [Methylogaea oryzae]
MAKKEAQAPAGKALQPQRPVALSPFDEMDRWFDEAFSRGWLSPMLRRHWPAWPELESPFGGRVPKVDVIDRPQEVVVRAELPGVAKDDLDVSLSDRTLTIRAAVQQEKKQDDEHYHRRELSRGEFMRAIALPGDMDGDKVKSSFKDGVLELVLPKVEGAKRKSIKVG